MARRFKPEKREILPDARFNNLHLQMMINRLMYSGKKSTATTSMYNAIDMIKRKVARKGSKYSKQP